MAHVSETAVPKGARIASVALGAIVAIDADRAKLYFDMVLVSLSESNLVALQNMQSFKYEYQSHFAKLYIAQGRVDIITRQLGSRFGEVSEEVNAQIASCSGEELNAIADRLLTAATLQEALAPKS